MRHDKSIVKAITHARHDKSIVKAITHALTIS